METIKLKHKLFKIKEEISLDMFIGEYKEKLYEICKYDPKTIEGKDLIYTLKKLCSCGVNAPKLFVVDKKSGYYAREYVDGVKMSDYLSTQDMTDKLFEQLFKNAYIAKINGMTLKYEPDKWILCNDRLYYTYPVFIRYQKEKDLAEHYIRLWFNTKELAEFLANINVFYDKSRIKEQYSTNKEIVLKVCKFYR